MQFAREAIPFLLLHGLQMARKFRQARCALTNQLSHSIALFGNHRELQFTCGIQLLRLP